MDLVRIQLGKERSGDCDILLGWIFFVAIEPPNNKNISNLVYAIFECGRHFRSFNMLEQKEHNIRQVRLRFKANDINCKMLQDIAQR